MATYSMSSAQTWATFKEQVDDTLIKALQPKIIYNLIAKTYPAVAGVMAYDNTQESWINPDEAGESGEYPGAAMRFERTYVSMKDIGVAPRIPLNWIKDSRFDLVNEHVEEIGFGIARYLNSDFLTCLNAFVVGSISYNGVTTPAGPAGHVTTATAVWSSTASDIIADIANALAVLGADDAADGEKYLIVHPTPFQYIMTDPSFMKYINYGNADLIQRGIFPTPFGINILVTSQSATTYALLVNKSLGAIKHYEREPLTTEIEKSARTQHLDIVARMRYAFVVGRPKGIVKINTIA